MKQKKSKLWLWIGIAVIVSLIAGGFVGSYFFESKKDFLRLNWNFQAYIINADSCDEEIYSVLSDSEISSRGFYFDGYGNTREYYKCSLTTNTIGEKKCSCGLTNKK